MNLYRNSGSTTEHAPAEFTAICAGESCPNWTNQPCEGSKYIWMNADATVIEGRDMSQPPFKDEAIFVAYGRVCLIGNTQEAIGYRVDDYGDESYRNDMTGLIVHGDSRFQDRDVDVYQVGLDESGNAIEELKHRYDGWG